MTIWDGRAVKIDGPLVLFSRRGQHDDWDTARDDEGCAFSLMPATLDQSVPGRVLGLQVLTDCVLVIRTQSGTYAMIDDIDGMRMEKIEC